jgi:hypothetical protein
LSVLLILFGAAFTVAVCIALGRLLLRTLGLRFATAEGLLFAFITGAAGFSLVIFLLCALDLAKPAVFLALGAAILATWRRAQPGSPLPPLSPFDRWFYRAILAAWFAFYFVYALAPETSPDGITYHLGLVSRYLREGGFHRITTDIYASFPQATEMLFLAAFAFGKHSAAKLVHFAFFAALAAMMICYGRRSGIPTAGACAAVLVFAAPVAALDGTSAYNDLAGACTVFALFYLLELWDGENRGLPVVAGLLAGFAFAIKYTLFTALLYAAAIVLWRSRRRKRDAGVLVAAALPPMLPWLIKNWLWVGNPVSPFLNQLFPNPYVYVSFEKDYTTFLRLPAYYRLSSFGELPLALTIKGNLTGVLGPVFLLAPLALLALARPQGRRLLLAAAVFVATYPANLGCRFLLPALPFISLALAQVLGRFRWLPPAVALVHAISCIPAVQDLYYRPLNFRLPDFPLRAALRTIPEETYLRSSLPAYAQARMIQDHVPEGRRVLALDDVATAYTSRDVLGPYHSTLSWRARDLLDVATNPTAAPARRLSFRFAERTARTVRLTQTAASANQSWSIHEIRVFRHGVAIPAVPGWRATAEPNSWDAPLAIDGSPVTRWRSWQAFHPGMWFEVDFGAAIVIDEVIVVTSKEQPAPEVLLDGIRAEISHTPTPAGLFPDALRELGKLGIQYVFVPDAHPLAPEFARRLRPAATALGARLYGLSI